MLYLAATTQMFAAYYYYAVIVVVQLTASVVLGQTWYVVFLSTYNELAKFTVEIGVTKII